MTSNANISQTARFRLAQATVPGLAAIAFLIGAAGFAGWVLDSPILKRVHPSLLTMKANTAICLMMAAVSLLFQRNESTPRGRRRMAQWLALFVLVVGASTLSEHIVGWDLGIDQLLFKETHEEAGKSFPGRMGVAGCLNFILLGLALLTIDRRIGKRNWAGIFAVGAAFVVLLTFLYYFYGVEELAAISRHLTIALHTVVAFLCLTLGILLARPERGLTAALLGDDLGSIVARRMIPVPLLIVVLGWLRKLGVDQREFGDGFGTAAFVLLVLILFTSLMWWTASAVNEAERTRKRTALDLGEAQRIARMGSWQWEEASDTTSGSEEIFRLFGLDPAKDEFPGMATGQKLYPPADWQRLKAAMAETLKTGRGFQQDVQGLRGGVTIWLTVRGELARNHRGETVGLRGTMQEITERKRWEEDLAATKRLLDTLLTTAPIGFCYISRDLKYVIINEWLARINGLTVEEHVGKYIADVCPALIDTVRKVTDKVLATGEPVRDHEFSGDTLAEPGVIRYWNESWYPLRDDKGEITGFGAVVSEITERKRAEQALRESEAVLRTVANEAHVGLVMISQKRRYLFANHTYVEILGLPEGDLVGRNIQEVLGDLYSQVQSRLDRAFAGERVSYELHLAKHSKTGREHFYEVVYEPRLDAVDEPYVVVVIVDITERKRAQQILEDTVASRTAALRETIGQLETFSYSITHDMRGPLRAMTSFAQILRSEYDGSLDDKAREYLRRIMEAANRLDRLIQDVLQYSRVAQRDLPLERVNLRRLIDDVIHQYPDIEQHRERVTVREECEDLEVLGNTAALTQVVSNLLTNALKFVPAGRTPQVSVVCAEAGDFIRMNVTDNGIGIAPQYQKQIFGIFQRLHGKEYAGTGIGLSIVKKAIERMGGRVGLESESGAGANFWVELRRASRAPTAVPTQQKAA